MHNSPLFTLLSAQTARTALPSEHAAWKSAGYTSELSFGMLMVRAIDSHHEPAPRHAPDRAADHETPPDTARPDAPLDDDVEAEPPAFVPADSQRAERTEPAPHADRTDAAAPATDGRGVSTDGRSEPASRSAPSAPAQAVASQASVGRVSETAAAAAPTPETPVPAEAAVPRMPPGEAPRPSTSAEPFLIVPRPDTPVRTGGVAASAARTAAEVADPRIMTAPARAEVTVDRFAERLVSQPAAARVPWTAAVPIEGAVAGQAATHKSGQGGAGGSTAGATPAFGSAAIPTAPTTPQPTLAPPIGPAAAPAPVSRLADVAAAGAVADAPEASGLTGSAPAAVGGRPALRAAATPTAAAQAETQRPADVTDQVSVRIARAVAEGRDRIEIRLKPAELGRVDIRLELTGDGRVQATITADTRQTLDLLRADARGLERALQDAGLHTDAGGLGFNLRGEGQTPERPWSTAPADRLAAMGEDAAADIAVAPPPAAAVAADGRIDIRA